MEACHRDDLAAVCNATHAGLTGTARRPTYRRNKHPGLFRTLCWGGVPASGHVSVDLEGADCCLWVDEVAGDAGTCLAVLRSLAETRECNELFFDRLHYKSAVGVRLRQLASCRLATGTRRGKPRWYVVRIVNFESVMTKLAPVLRERTRPCSSRGERALRDAGHATVGVFPAFFGTMSHTDAGLSPFRRPG